MIVTVACDIYGRKNNGSDIVADNLITFLQRQGHEVRILCADQSKKNVPGYYVVPPLFLIKPLRDYVDKVGVTLPVPDLKIIDDAVKGADIVHVMMPFALGLTAAKYALHYKIPITAGFHAQAENITGYLGLEKVENANKLVYHFIYNHLYKYCAAIHYPTKFIRDVFEESIGKTTPGYVISNGVHSYVKRRPSEKPEEYKDKIVILTTGRYAEEKDQGTLIKAVKLSKYADKIQLILGGEGIKEKEYRKLAEGMPVPPLFKFYSRTEIIDVLNYADIYVHPAKVELEGISCIEAIACGKLTIVSDSKLSATHNFAVDEKCIFHAEDEKDLARVIDYWIEHPEERKEYENKYLNSAVAFDQEKCMEKMEDMLGAAIKTYLPK